MGHSRPLLANGIMTLVQIKKGINGKRCVVFPYAQIHPIEELLINEFNCMSFYCSDSELFMYWLLGLYDLYGQLMVRSGANRLDGWM